MSEQMIMVCVWLAVFVITIIIEASTQDLIAVWFSIGSVIALILSAFPIAWYIQVVIFAVVSVLITLLMRPLAKKLLFNSIRYTNIDEYVGKHVKVTTAISKFETGEVRLNDIIYHATLLEDEDEDISVGEIVEIIAFKGNKVVVKKLN